MLGSGVAVMLSAVLAVGLPPAGHGRDLDSSGGRLVVTTANIRRTLGPARALADLRRALRGSSVVAAQEMGRRRVSVAGWGRYQPARGPCSESAIYWRAQKLSRVAARAVVLERAPRLRAGTRCAVVVTLEPAGGRPFVVIGFHALPHVERAGRPRPERPRRVAAYARGMARLDRLRDRISRPYVIAGDTNVDRRADRRIRWHGFPAATLGPGTLEPASSPTLGRRRDVDRLFARRSTWEIVGHSVIRRTYSDHNFARFTLTRR